MEKVDARKLGSEGRDTLRKMVIRLRQQSGMKAIELSRVAGVHVRTVESWLRKARAAGTG
ncbi:MAG: IS630 family transposase, partial [Dechloromonas sp.]